MSGTDGVLASSLYSRPHPLDGPLPDVLVTFDDEYVVEWQQVTGIGPVALPGAGGEPTSL